MTIKSIKHKKEKRALIPSTEESGAEQASPSVLQGKTKLELPLSPVIQRGADPELFWMNKYNRDREIVEILADLEKSANGSPLSEKVKALKNAILNQTPDIREELLKVDIRSLYRHEHISPEVIMKHLYTLKEAPIQQTNIFDMFGDGMKFDEIEKVSEYYKHGDNWSNRLIQGDSLLVMTSLLEREGMAGKVQMIYMDPPYGIKYGSNWQMKLNNRNVKDGDDADLSGEPEQIKAYRDTWELGIHSYLSYLRERLLVARDLLNESGSCFVQISDENVHLVRCLMDEVFGSENFVRLITFAKTGSMVSTELGRTSDYLIWYAKDKEHLKYRQLYSAKVPDAFYSNVELSDGTVRKITRTEMLDISLLPSGARVFRLVSLESSGSSKEDTPFEFEGEMFRPNKNSHWKLTYPEGMKALKNTHRIVKDGEKLHWKYYIDDYPLKVLSEVWNDTAGFNPDQRYVVETRTKVVERCLLMTTDPGDLVLDPTCGSGTTAYVAEQWGRRWITIDTSRIALNIAKSRLLTASFPYYKLYDEANDDIRQGFIYKKVPHITLKSIANDEPPEEETLFDQPEIDKKKIRVAGPFTCETLQNFEPIAPEELDKEVPDKDEIENFEERIFEHLKSAGVKNGVRNECAVFIRVDRINSGYLHAEGFYNSTKGERKAYIHIGPKFGTVSRQAVNEAIKECRSRGDADWLIILGFTFESDIENQNVTTSMGSFEVTKARMHDDLMQDGLLKKDKKAASFVTIGEPDIQLVKENGKAFVEIRGLDIYDPMQDEVKERDVADIAYWMVDDDYDGSNFMVKQVFFCGGDKDEFDKWKKGLSSLAASGAKRKAEKTFKIEIDDEAFERLYGHKSHPIEIKKKGQKIAVRVISQFGEECTKVFVSNEELL